jgi:hypothetical protein
VKVWLAIQRIKLDKLFIKLRLFWFVNGRYALNPLVKYPRNEPCWCGSREKAKRCCLPTLSRVVLAEQAVLLKHYLMAVDVYREHR